MADANALIPYISTGIAPASLEDQASRDISASKTHVTSIKQLMADRPKEEEVAVWYQAMKQRGAYMGASFAALSLRKSIASTVADVDGKYLLPDVPPGRYYLFAAFDSTAGNADWLIPVEIKPGQELRQDLHN